jgi:hypothetical protein
MSSALKKSYVLLTGLLMSAAAPLQGSDCCAPEEPSCCEPFEVIVHRHAADPDVCHRSITGLIAFPLLIAMS